MQKRKVSVCILAFLSLLFFRPALGSEYQHLPGLIDIRTSFSDGAYDLKTIAGIAKKRGFRAIIINDHDRMAMEYGIPPFRNIARKRIELGSINKNGAENYLNAIRKARNAYPDMIIIPGSETAPFYYWTGSYFQGNLTANNHEKRLLTIGMEEPEDYDELPVIHNGLSTRFTPGLLPMALFFLVPLVIGVFLLIKHRGGYRAAGVAIAVFSLLCMVNLKLFRSTPFDQYQGDRGTAPYQLVIDYVNSRAGMVFWNYPETSSGRRRMGKISVKTLPYPEVLLESRGYTGFAALYGDNITVTEPGNIWDQVLMEYCSGNRERPVWGISTADYHREGENGQRLGDFPTVFFVREGSKQGLLRAMKQGRMYACSGDYPQRMVLDEFSISSRSGRGRSISGGESVLRGFPRIKILLSSKVPSHKEARVRLIRTGKPINTFTGTLPMSIDYVDNYFEPGEKIFYRLDAKGCGMLVSNPIFVRFEQ